MRRLKNAIERGDIFSAFTCNDERVGRSCDEGIRFLMFCSRSMAQESATGGGVGGGAARWLAGTPCRVGGALATEERRRGRDTLGGVAGVSHGSVSWDAARRR